MNLTLRTRIFIIITIAILLILAVSITLVVISKKRQITDAVPTGDQTTTQDFQNNGGVINPTIQPTVITQDLTIKPQTDEEKMYSAAINIAKIFTERYGSYSTENPGQNLKDLEVLSTPELWTVLQKRIDSMTQGGEFVGVTTRAFSATVITYENNQATVRTISTREENKNGTLRTYNQEAELMLLRKGEGWLVDDIKWK